MPDRLLLQSLVNTVRQPGARGRQTAQLAEEIAPQRYVRLQCIGQHGKAHRHAAETGGRDFLEVAQGLFEFAGHRAAIVQVHRAAVFNDAVEDRRTAGHMAPGQPFEQHRIGRVVAAGHVGGVHGHGGAEHALGHRNCLGHTGRARGEEDLGHRVGADGVQRRGQRGVHCRLRAGLQDIGPERGSGQVHRLVNLQHPPASQVQTRQRTLEPKTTLDKQHRRLHQGDHGAQLGMVVAEQGIGRRHRHIRHARLHGRHFKHRVLQRVATEHHHRAARRMVRQQPPADRVDLALRLAIGQRYPLAAAALDQPGAGSTLAGALTEGARQMGLHLAQGDPAAHQEHTALALLEIDVPIQERQRQEWGFRFRHLGQAMLANTHISNNKVTLSFEKPHRHRFFPNGNSEKQPF